MSIIHSMLIHGMIVVDSPDWLQPFGASAITKEGPFDESKHLELGYVDPCFLNKSRELGKQAAELTVKLNR